MKRNTGLKWFNFDCFIRNKETINLEIFYFLTIKLYNMNTSSYLQKVHFDLLGQHFPFLFSVNPFSQPKLAGNPFCVKT